MSRRQNIAWKSDNPALVEFLECDTCWKLARTVKKNARRTVYRVQSERLECSIFLKHEHPPTAFSRLKNLFRPKARLEFNAGMALAAAGVPVIRMLAWGRDGAESFLVTAEAEDVYTFDDLWARCRLDLGLRSRFIQALGFFLSRLLCARVSHPDMHSGNLIGLTGADGMQFLLVDVYGITTKKRLSHGDELRLFAWLRSFFRELNPEEVTTLMTKALGTDEDAADRFFRDVLHFQARAAVHRWRGRKRRLLRESSLCSEEKTEQGRWLLRKPFTLETARDAAERHFSDADASANTLLKNDRKRQISRIQTMGKTYVIKVFSDPGVRGPFRPDRISWLNAYRLELHSVPAARHYAWLRLSAGLGLLTMEDVGPLCLYHELARLSPLQRRPLLYQAATLLALIHTALVAPRDMKMSNIMIHQKPGFPHMPLTLIDCDSIRFSRRVRDRDRTRNLGQMLGTIKGGTGWLERLRFLAKYRQEARLSKTQMRRLLKGL